MALCYPSFEVVYKGAVVHKGPKRSYHTGTIDIHCCETIYTLTGERIYIRLKFRSSTVDVQALQSSQSTYTLYIIDFLNTAKRIAEPRFNLPVFACRSRRDGNSDATRICFDGWSTSGNVRFRALIEFH